MGHRVIWLGQCGVHHLVGGAEAEGFIDGPACIGCVQRDDADGAAAGFFHGELDKAAGEAALAIGGFNENVEQVGAFFALWVEGVRRPVEDKHSRGCDGIAGVHCDPAKVAPGANHALGP